jgi:hypothetical protein
MRVRTDYSRLDGRPVSLLRSVAIILRRPLQTSEHVRLLQELEETVRES